jgi:uncharacterized protein DUF262
MATFSRAIYSIAKFVRWANREELILQPKFQRRLVWEEKARSYLIDTIVRELPMPKIYMRRVVHPRTKLSAYEVVDGQQRLRAILDFHSGNLVLSRRLRCRQRKENCKIASLTQICWVAPLVPLRLLNSTLRERVPLA